MKKHHNAINLGMPDNLREALDRLAILSRQTRTASEILAGDGLRPPARAWTPWWVDR